LAVQFVATLGKDTGFSFLNGSDRQTNTFPAGKFDTLAFGRTGQTRSTALWEAITVSGTGIKANTAILVGTSDPFVVVTLLPGLDGRSDSSDTDPLFTTGTPATTKGTIGVDLTTTVGVNLCGGVAGLRFRFDTISVVAGAAGTHKRNAVSIGSTLIATTTCSRPHRQ
jgi:hypothetical protein